MAHTGEDYSEEYKQTEVFGNLDNAELSARQNINSFYDRRGTVVWFDTFEAAAALKWYLTMTAGGTQALSADRAWIGDQSIKFVTQGAINSYCRMAKRFSLPFSHRIGLELMYCPISGSSSCWMSFIAYSGTYYCWARIRFDWALSKLYYWDAGGNWVELTIRDHTSVVEHQWYPMKLVIDLDAGEYVRLLFCGTNYDLSGILMEQVPDAQLQDVYVDIYEYSTAADVSTCYFDNIILTQNE